MRSFIEELWDVRDTLTSDSLKEPEIKKAILDVIDNLDCGKARVAYKEDGEWKVNEWAKKAIILYLKSKNSYLMSDGVHRYYDNVSLKFDGWSDDKFSTSKIRITPATTVKKGSFLAYNTFLLPSFVDIGVYIGEGSKIGSYSSIGSCTQIGKHSEICDGVSIGGVLEPMDTLPAIIEDRCYIGSKSHIGGGVIIGEGTVIGNGVLLDLSTRIYDINKKEISFKKIPPYSIVVSGTLMIDKNSATNCAIIAGKTSEEIRAKKSVFDILKG